MLSRSSRNSSSWLLTRHPPGGNRLAYGCGRREGAGLADAAVSRRSAGAHSGVRLAVVPLSGEVRSGCEPPSLDIYAKRSKNVRLQNNPNDGVNREALLRRAAENFRGERRDWTRPRRSPEFSMAAHATLAEPQVFGYVEETTRSSGGHT
jgi:hypothetical protein